MGRIVPQLALGLLLVFHGCHLGPKYEVPASPIPEAWKAEAPEDPLPFSECWWEVFKDETLIQLEQRLLAANPDLYAALERVAKARGLAGVSKADLYPQLSLEPSYNDVGELIELYGVPPGLIPGLKTIVRVHEMTYQLPLNMSYEVDLWQKNLGKYNAASAYAQSEQEAYRAKWLMLTSDLASHYFNAKTLDTQIRILNEILNCYGNLLSLRQMRYLVGLDSYLEVLSAIEQFENSQAELDDAIRQRVLFEDAIAALIGTAASCFELPSCLLSPDLPVIPAGLPSELLIRRPDIAQAERFMAAEHALIGVAYASFFPSLNLTGALGFLSPDLSQFLTWQGHLWHWGAKIFETVFDGWRNCSKKDIAYARFKEAEGIYQKTVLGAFQEVEDALNNLAQEAKQSESLFNSWQAAAENAALFDKRFEIGLSSQIEVLTSKLSDLRAETRWVNVLGMRYQATVQMIQALGGSWHTQTTSKFEQ